MKNHLFFSIAAATFILGATSYAASVDSGIINNSLSSFFITVDGQFTDGLINGAVQGEWSDITPQAFVAPATNSGTLFRTSLGDPNANALLYAGLAPGALGPTELYLMYVYRDRMNPNFASGEFVADISFPITLSPGGLTNITIQIRGQLFQPTADVSSFFDVFIDLDNNGTPDGNAIDFGIQGAVGFGASPLTNTPHLLIELEVPLLIPEGFGQNEPNPVFPPGGLPNGVYSPEPAFWGASAANDLLDPPISSALFTINPDGSTSVNSSHVALLPEPSTLLVTGLLSLLGLIRRSRG